MHFPDLLLVGGHHHQHFLPTAISDTRDENNKAGIIARSNHQRPGIDYNESSFSVMHSESLRTLLALPLTN